MTYFLLLLNIYVRVFLTVFDKTERKKHFIIASQSHFFSARRFPEFLVPGPVFLYPCLLLSDIVYSNSHGVKFTSLLFPRPQS
jgi:hypothetical protein